MSGTISSLADNLGNVIGSGSDAITLKVSEDSAGSGPGSDAQFTVNVDGQQIGGLQTATASHSSGQSDTFTFRGDFAPGEHKVAVTFTNNAGTQGDKSDIGRVGDRNLYIDSVSYNGDTISSTTTPIYESPLFPPNGPLTSGNAVFTVNDTTSINGGSGVVDSATPGAIDVGSGADTLTLHMAEDPYQGDAQFTVAVDGQQVGDTLTTTAIAWQGQQQTFNLHGDWGSGAHTVTVNYLSDHIGAVDGAGNAYDNTDQNLFVMGGDYDGIAISGTPWELSSNGPHDFNVPAGGQPGNSVSDNNDSTVVTGSSDTGSKDDTSSSSTGMGSSTDNPSVVTGASGDSNSGDSGTSGTGTMGGGDVVPVNTSTINGQTGNGQTGSSSGDESSSTSGSGSSGSDSGMSFIPGSNDDSSSTGKDNNNTSSGSSSTDNTQTGGWTGGGDNWWDNLSSKDFHNAWWNNNANNVGNNWQDWLSSVKSQAQSQGWWQGSDDNGGGLAGGSGHWSGFQNTAG
jgi:hypothetical protein